MLKKLLYLSAVVLSAIYPYGETFAQVAAQTQDVASRGSSESELELRIKQIVTDGLSNREENVLEVVLDSLRTARCKKTLSKSLFIWGEGDGACLWGNGDFSTLNLANVTANTEGGSIYTDVLTSYFGPVRMGIGTLVASSPQENESSTEGELENGREALQRLVAGGGNLLVGAQYPLVYRPFDSWNDLKITGAVLARAATDVGALGASPEARSSSGAIAGDLRIQFTSNDHNLSVFAYGRAESILGDGTLFIIPTLGDPTTAAQEYKELSYRQYALGARLWGSVLVTWTKYDCDACRALGLGNQVSITTQRTMPE